MPLHPYLADRLPLLRDLPREAPSADGPDPAGQARLDAFADDGDDWAVPAGVGVEDRVVAGPHGDLPLRIYRPAAPTDHYLLWAHGGGFAAGTLDWPESHVVSAELAARAGAVVVAVDYHLAGPAVRYPIPIDDVSAAWSWLRGQAYEECPRPTLALGGASAGAALALAAGLRLGPVLDALLLCYPFVHFPVPALDPAFAAEMAELPDVLRFFPETNEQMVANYVGRLHSLPADALPGHAPFSRAQPPTAVLLSEYDDLRPSGELVARQLAEAGVEVAVRLEPGVLHGHLNRYPNAPGVSPSLDWMADFLRGTTARR